jgi:transposase
MEVMYESVSGLDVHKKTVVACVRRVGAGGRVWKEVRTFATMTQNLLALKAWLKEHGVTHVAMESTGILWRPVYNLLEDDFTVLVVNARHLKQVPGRKTDVKDCEWIAQLLQGGLLRGSFVPPRDRRELRDLTRHRVKLVQQHTQVVNRLHAVLQDANIKLSSVATNILGVSGREMIEALQRGDDDPEQLAELARGRLRAKLPQLRTALEGQVREHHRFLLAMLVDQLDYLAAAIDKVGQRIEAISSPSFRAAVELLTTADGIQQRTAETVLAEIGTDMAPFRTHKHLSSWAGTCPGNNESAGKRKSGKTPKGNRWLRGALGEAAWAASHKKNTYLAAQFAASPRAAARSARSSPSVTPCSWRSTTCCVSTPSTPSSVLTTSNASIRNGSLAITSPNSEPSAIRSNSSPWTVLPSWRPHPEDFRSKANSRNNQGAKS